MTRLCFQMVGVLLLAASGRNEGAVAVELTYGPPSGRAYDCVWSSATSVSVFSIIDGEVLVGGAVRSEARSTVSSRALVTETLPDRVALQVTYAEISGWLDSNGERVSTYQSGSPACDEDLDVERFIGLSFDCAIDSGGAPIKAPTVSEILDEGFRRSGKRGIIPFSWESSVPFLTGFWPRLPSSGIQPGVSWNQDVRAKKWMCRLVYSIEAVDGVHAVVRVRGSIDPPAQEEDEVTVKRASVSGEITISLRDAMVQRGEITFDLATESEVDESHTVVMDTHFFIRYGVTVAD